MSRERVRPTRDETRQRLFEASATVFAEHGVAAATIEQITSAAGFSRGAFYSNFATKEDLAVAMLDAHLAASQAHNRALSEEHPDAVDLVQALRSDTDRAHDPLHLNPLLQVELMLHVARTPSLRPRLGEHLRTMRHLVGDIAARALHAAGLDPPVTPQALGEVLVALEDGLRLHRMIDPEATEPDAFFTAVETLITLVQTAREPASRSARRS